jgi:excisionase family DNA binding protein
MVLGMTEPPDDEWLRIGAGATQLGVSVDTLRTWCDAGKVPCWRTPGGERRIRRSVIEQMLSEQVAS